VDAPVRDRLAVHVLHLHPAGSGADKEELMTAGKRNRYLGVCLIITGFIVIIIGLILAAKTGQ
jgi:hypothetical protein